MRMEKTVITKDDGRYLIFYTFPDMPVEHPGIPRTAEEQERAEEELNKAQPETTRSERS